MARSYYQNGDDPELTARPADPADVVHEQVEHEPKREHSTQRPERHAHKHCHDERDSELEEIDRLHCRNTGDKAKSAYVDGFETKLVERKGLLATLPGAYTAERATVLGIINPDGKAPSVMADLESIRKELTCQLAEATRATFDQAWERVQLRVSRCTGSPRLHPDPRDCEFLVKPGEDTKVLSVHQQQFTERVTTAEAQFDALAREPAELKQRGVDLAKEVTDLKTLAAKEPSEYPAAYAALLVAEHHATQEVILEGVATANTYEYYLRQCLNCSIHGRRALAEIVGELAVRNCRSEKRRSRCQNLLTHLAAEILAEVDDLEDEHQHHHH